MEFSMRILFVAKALAATLLAFVLAPVARAEIYTWVDAQGRTNISNLAPPEGARVTRVVHEAPPNPYNDAARDAAQKAELESLAQRVDQLQIALQNAVRQPPPQPQPQVIIVPAAAPVQYVSEPEPAPQAQDCNYGWTCNGWWNPGFPPFVSYVYVPSARFRNPSHFNGQGGRGDRGDRGPPRRPPMKTLAMTRP
jgi:hypothetical protein